MMRPTIVLSVLLLAVSSGCSGSSQGIGGSPAVALGGSGGGGGVGGEGGTTGGSGGSGGSGGEGGTGGTGGTGGGSGLAGCSFIQTTLDVAGTWAANAYRAPDGSFVVQVDNLTSSAEELRFYSAAGEFRHSMTIPYGHLLDAYAVAGGFLGLGRDPQSPGQAISGYLVTFTENTLSDPAYLEPPKDWLKVTAARLRPMPGTDGFAVFAHLMDKAGEEYDGILPVDATGTPTGDWFVDLPSSVPNSFATDWFDLQTNDLLGTFSLQVLLRGNYHLAQTLFDMAAGTAQQPNILDISAPTSPRALTLPDGRLLVADGLTLYSLDQSGIEHASSALTPNAYTWLTPRADGALLVVFPKNPNKIPPDPAPPVNLYAVDTDAILGEPLEVPVDAPYLDAPLGVSTDPYILFWADASGVAHMFELSCPP